jgi:lipopolysaccharide transport system ATP-binding protein
VEFSGVGKFLDTPVKHYSSGMQVRLAFSVAAHMEPDILIVDEVLAVGDAEFQKKSMGKMEEVTRTEGRTILFVSHNMTAIKNLCSRTIFLEEGRVKMIGTTEKVIDYYLNESAKETAVIDFPIKQWGDKRAHIQRTSILRQDGTPSTQIPISEPFSIEVEYKVAEPLTAATISAGIYRDGELLLLSSGSDKEGVLERLEPGRYKTQIYFPPFLFNVGSYFFEILIHKPMAVSFDRVQDLYFEIIDADNPRATVFAGHHPGVIASILEHKTYKID